MPYFRDDEARSIIRETHGQMESRTTAEADALYTPGETSRAIVEGTRAEIVVGAAGPGK